MKRFLCIMLALLMLLPLGIVPAEAVGDINGSNDSGLLGLGSAGNYWTPGKEGVRVTVVDLNGNQVGSTVDYSNNNLGANVYHFKGRSKIDYRAGCGLSVKEGYYTWQSLSGLPKIISENGSTANMDAIKDFFSTNSVLDIIARNAGMTFSVLTDGEHKILIEPIAYFYYMGNPYAMTATEAAFYDQLVCGDLYHRMGNLTHRNLPLAMFLTYADLHFPSYASSGGSYQSRAKIIERLGLMIWSNDAVEEGSTTPGNPSVESPTHYDYHTDIDVYTTAALKNTGAENYKGTCTATLTITGDKGFTETVTAAVTVPANRNGLVWWKWHTPEEEQNLTMTVTFNKAAVKPVNKTITASVTAFELEDPPDPKPTDTNRSWRLGATPASDNRLTASWGGWSYGQQTLSEEKIETVYYYTEYPSSTWSIWSSLIKVNTKEEIPTSSGAYEVRDLSESKTETKQEWSDWQGPYLYSQVPQSTATKQYKYHKTEEDWSPWETITTSSPKSDTSSTQYRLVSTGYTYSSYSNASSYTNPANVYTSDCYYINYITQQKKYGPWEHWYADPTWYGAPQSNTDTKQWNLVETKRQGGITFYKYTCRTRSYTWSTLYNYYYRTRTGTKYTYKTRYFQGYLYYYSYRELQTLTETINTFQYRYRRKIWTGSDSWSTGSERVPAKVTTQESWNWLTYSAGLDVLPQVIPDAAVKTVITKNGRTYLKSGYGVDAKVITSTFGDHGGYCTGVQLAYNLFPEFDYTTYGRILEYDSGAGAWVYRENVFSPHNYRVHYTPLWYPDKTEYPVFTYAGDCWTPGGELHSTGVASLWIDGNLYDDWTVGEAN